MPEYRIASHCQGSAHGPWHVPLAVEDIAEAGQDLHLVAEKEARAAVARLAGLRDLPRLEASFNVTRYGAGGLHVVGCVSATVGQTCVITLEPLANEIEEAIDLKYLPPSPARTSESENTHEQEMKWDEPEPLIGGRIDLGALATEFLILGLDPYPRKPGVVFRPPPQVAADAAPFAMLAVLKKDRDGR